MRTEGAHSDAGLRARVLPRYMALLLVLILIRWDTQAMAGTSSAPAPAAATEFRGPVVLKLTLPDAATGSSEPILCCGKPGLGEIVFVHFLGPRRIAIGWEQTGFGVVLSKPVDVKTEGPHEIAVSLGSMLPADGKAYTGPSKRWEMMHKLTSIRFDGKMVMMVRHALPSEFSPSAALLGLNTVGGTMAGARFHGRILAARAWEYDDSLSLQGQEYPGPVCLYLQFPAYAANRADPLLTTGHAGAGDVLYVKYVDEEHVRFGLDHWGTGGPLSEPVLAEPGQQHEIVMSTDSTMPPPPPDANDFYSALRRRCLIMCDGRVVLDSALPLFPSKPSEIAIAANPIGASTCGEVFSGVLNETGPADSQTVARLINPATWSDKQALTLDGRNYPGPVRLLVSFDPNRSGNGEPLVVTGQKGAGDVLFVRYEAGGRVRFGFDHWGYGGALTDPIDVDPKKVHEIVVSLGSLLPPPDLSQPDRFARLRDRCIVLFDGKVLIDAPSEFYPSAPSEINIAFNPIGGSSADIGFTGDLKHVYRTSLSDLLKAIH